jgi:hypothetical protein
MGLDQLSSAPSSGWNGSVAVSFNVYDTGSGFKLRILSNGPASAATCNHSIKAATISETEVQT